MAAESVSDDPPRGFSRAVLTAAFAIAAVAVTAAVTIEKPFLHLVDLLFLFPYPLIALAAAPLIAWIVARVRHAPARSRTGLLVPWSWVIARFALMVAVTYTMIAWVIAALIGASVAAILLETFLLTTVARFIFFIVEQCAIEVGRAIRGPARAGS